MLGFVWCTVLWKLLVSCKMQGEKEGGSHYHVILMTFPVNLSCGDQQLAKPLYLSH